MEMDCCKAVRGAPATSQGYGLNMDSPNIMSFMAESLLFCTGTTPFITWSK